MSAIGSTNPILATRSSETCTNYSAVCNILGNLREGREGNEILGTSNTLLGIRKVSRQEQRQRLVHHLRHRNVEGRERDDVDVLLHGAPQNPLLRPDLREPVRPHAAELRLGCGGIPDRGRAVHLAPRQSSVLVKSGAYSLPRPLRRSSADVSAMSGAVAAVVAVQLQNGAARLPSSQKGHH